MTRRWLPILLILIGGWGLLEALSFHAGLGEYAKSPQRLQLSQGKTSIVAGGQAGLVFMEDRFRKKAQLLVRCKEGRRAINLRPGQISDEVCGIRVELLEILPAGRVNVVVRWGDDAATTDNEPANQDAANQDTANQDAANQDAANQSEDGAPSPAAAGEETPATSPQ